MIVCPVCGHETKEKLLPPVTIRGEAMEIVKRTQIPKRYIFVSDQEVLYCPPIPLLIVKARDE